MVAANGTLTKEAWKANPDAPIDCFYVYPRCRPDTTDNSDMNPDPAELNVVRQQFARFGSVCRLYAPMSRQVTLAGLRKVLAGGGRRDLTRSRPRLRRRPRRLEGTTSNTTTRAGPSC